MSDIPDELLAEIEADRLIALASAKHGAMSPMLVELARMAGYPTDVTEEEFWALFAERNAKK